MSDNPFRYQSVAGVGVSVLASVAAGASPQLPPVPQSIINVATNANLPLATYGPTLVGGAYTDAAWNGGWQVPLAVAAVQGNTSVNARLLQQINYNLQGDKTIAANGGYPAQHELFMTGAYAILKQSDSFWNNVLNSTQRQKIDLLMKAAVVSSAYTTADASYSGGKQITTLDGDRNLHRGWNANYQEGMFGGLIAGSVYFGGTSQVNQILDTYDHDAFVAQLNAAGLTNTARTFNTSVEKPSAGAPNSDTIEANIRNYRFEGKPLADPFDQYARLALQTYSKTVSAGLNGGTGVRLANGKYSGVVVSGASQTPNLGQLGMLQEFDTYDARGPRSSADYAYYGFRPDLINQIVVLMGGYWEAGDLADQIVARQEVGIADLEYKLQRGYWNYANGGGWGEPFNIHRADWSWSFQTMLPTWNDVVRPYFNAVPEPGTATSLMVAAWGLGRRVRRS